MGRSQPYRPYTRLHTVPRICVTNIPRNSTDKHSTEIMAPSRESVSKQQQDTKGNTAPDLCLEGCKCDRQHAGKQMVRCCQCSSWIHAECIAEKEEYVPGVWSCFQCQLMPSHICQMQTNLSKLMTVAQTLTTSIACLRDDHQRLTRQLEDRGSVRP